MGPPSPSRIGSHIGRDKLVSEPRPTIGAPLIDRTVGEYRGKTILSLVICRMVGILFTPYPRCRSGEEL